MLISPRESFTFDDVMLVPTYSTVKSRSNVKMTVNLPKGFCVESPLVPANMRDVIGAVSSSVFYDKGCMILKHRFCSIGEQIQFMNDMTYQKGAEVKAVLGCSIGVRTEHRSDVDTLVGHGYKIVCIDVAHGDSEQCVDMVEYVSSRHPGVLLIAGNVATAEGAYRLWKAGADVVKVGIGPGSICTTRKETGNGVPQMSALAAVHRVRIENQKYFAKNLAIISDGGIKSSGDCVKALCYADLVMIGSLFAGANESPGELACVGTKTFKKYNGSSTHKSNRIEGTIILRPSSGPLADIIDNLTEGIQSGCSYQNCHKVSDLKEDPVFVRVTTGQQNLDQNKETFRV